MTTVLPVAFAGLERYAADWALPTRAERYAMRLSKPFAELVEFYDAVAARAEEAIQHLNERELGSLEEADVRLLQLLYSFILVSYAVNIFDQPKIPDSGAAFFDCVLEPTV